MFITFLFSAGAMMEFLSNRGPCYAYSINSEIIVEYDIKSKYPEYWTVDKVGRKKSFCYEMFRVLNFLLISHLISKQTRQTVR